jgi:GTPase SAR1 family protein
MVGADIVFLVYDLSQGASQNCLEYWWKELENHVSHSNVYVIGNKLDEKNIDMEGGFAITEK